MKKILVLGGTMFVGRSLVAKLISNSSYDVTLFNRGKSNTHLFPDVKQIHGDRETDDIKKILNQDWDCIIDFSGYYPLTFEKLLEALKGKVKRYIFISTVSVYDIGKFVGKTITEAHETQACTEEQNISKLMAAYGEKKAEMERILLKQDGLDKIIFRPSFIYGKYDYTERFYYWLYRATFFDKILMPGADTPLHLSLTNATDLMETLLLAIEIKNHQPVYNVISQPVSSLKEFISITAKAMNRPVPEIVELDEKRLESLRINAGQFPLFVPVSFKVDDSLWTKDFSFTRTDMTNAFVEMLNYKAEKNFPEPTIGLRVETEKKIIIAL